MDKEDVVHIYKRILVSHKRKKTVSYVEMWMYIKSVTQSKSEREKQMSNIDAYM